MSFFPSLTLADPDATQGYPDEDGQTTLNPFSKARNPRKRAKKDDENEDLEQLDRTQSEGTALNTAELKRKSLYSGPKVPHFQTMPENVRDEPSNANGGLPEGSYDDENITDPTKRAEGSSALNSDTEPVDRAPAADELDRPREQQGASHGNSHFPAFLRNRHKQKDLESQANSNDSDPENNKKPKFSAWSQIRYSLFNSWVNILLICAPIGIALHAIKTINPIAVFVVNFIAIVPLAGTLSYATEEIALRTGETIGGLLNASFG